MFGGSSDYCDAALHSIGGYGRICSIAPVAGRVYTGSRVCLFEEIGGFMEPDVFENSIKECLAEIDPENELKFTGDQEFEFDTLINQIFVHGSEST